jgi:hypothetical protein
MSCSCLAAKEIVMKRLFLLTIALVLLLSGIAYGLIIHVEAPYDGSGYKTFYGYRDDGTTWDTNKIQAETEYFYEGVPCQLASINDAAEKELILDLRPEDFGIRVSRAAIGDYHDDSDLRWLDGKMLSAEQIDSADPYWWGYYHTGASSRLSMSTGYPGEFYTTTEFGWTPGSTLEFHVPAKPIPKPATILLLGSGLVGFAVPRIRRKLKE